MKILAINCGSSTLKFQCLEFEGGEAIFGRESRMAHGIIERIGGKSAIQFIAQNGHGLSETTAVANHSEATHRVLKWLDSLGIMGESSLTAAGHRVVHGGGSFVKPTLINDEVVSEIESNSHLAPLHNEPALSAIRAAREILGTDVPQVAVFDTAFHHSLPERAARYAIPIELADKHKIRRYGFHGLAHRYMNERYATIAAKPIEQTKLITLQLGNGCSAAAIDGGQSVDTSMGFTPLEGLVMGTRSGDLDPSLIGFLARHEYVEVGVVEKWLNSKSGLLGVSGHSNDMRELLDAEAHGNASAALAIEIFCYRVRKYLGAYLAVLGGADAIVFGGGIGENSPPVRARICQGMEWCGLSIDQQLNSDAIGIEAAVHSKDSIIRIFVIPVDEGSIVARDTVRFLFSR